MMGKQRRLYFRRSLCGMLSAAMIMSGLLVPDATVYAAQSDVMENAVETGTENEDIGKEENGEENRGGGNSEGTGNQEGASEEPVNPEEGEGKGNPDDPGEGEEKDEEPAENEDTAPDETSDDVTEGEDNEEIEENPEEETENAQKLFSVERTGAYGELQNGDFETAASDNEYTPAVWSVAYEGSNTYYKYEATGGNPGHYVQSVWSDSGDTAFSLSQVIENFQPGDYTLSVDINGSYDDNTVYAKIEKVMKNGDEYTASGEPLLNQSLGSSTAWTWNTFTSTKITVPDNVDAIRVSFEGTLGSSKQIKLDNVKLNNGEQEEEPENRNITFYYYSEEEVGLYLWDKDNGGHISTTADTADWQAWAAGDIRKMMPVEGYAGWYSVSLSFSGDASDGNSSFKIVKKSSPTGSDFDTGSNDDNKAIYNNKLIGGTEKSYAMKKWKLYEGISDVTAILRNVTLYAYDTTGAPCIQFTKDTSVSVVDETTGTVSALSGKTEVEGGDGYIMTADTKENWYYLTFSAPGNISFDSAKICNLYTKGAGGSYSWAKNLVNGPTDEWGIDFTPAFSGSVFYKDGVLSDSRSISLGELKTLYGEAKEKYDAGKGSYSDASWTAFDTAVTNASAAINSLSGKTDEYTDDSPDPVSGTSVESVYTALKNAMDGLAMEITFYYYIGEAKAAGFTYWANDGLNPLSTSASQTSGWYGWNNAKNTTYQMTAVAGCPGWYSIPIAYTHDGGEDAGFSIHSYDGSKSTEVFTCSKKWDATEIYSELFSGEESAYAVSKGVCYAGEDLITALMRNVKIYVYDNEGVPAIGTASDLFYVSESKKRKDVIVPSQEKNGVKYHNMAATESNANWYEMTFSAPEADEQHKICGLYSLRGGEDGEEAVYELVKTFVEGTASDADAVDFTEAFAGKIYYKNGIWYEKRPSTIDDLAALVKEADELAEGEKVKPKYKHENDGGAWTTFETKLAAANAVLEKDKTEDKPADEEVIAAYDGLDTAMKKLVPIPLESESISVERVAVDDDFITGADVSSYVSLKESGVVFKDADGEALSDAGFFKLLHDGGTNWVRIRVWNDPYNSSNGNGYGGGNSDLEKAKAIGRLATNAGMRVLIDFHYSDFWADPAKQEAPKAWESYTVDQKVKAVRSFTRESLEELKAAGVDVGMVQVGNETNNGICGEHDWVNMAKIFNAGSEAVRAFDPECLVAIHFAEPQASNFVSLAGNLKTNNVDYDVFASSYYPFWHGTTGNLTEKLTQIAKDYDKKVMVAETSWVTTWEDGDGHGNSAPKITQELNYSVSLQGQADEIRDVVAAVEKVNNTVPGAAIGMFYWEPAWISPYYAYNADGSVDQSLYRKNKELWEKYGSGWASSYSVEYDPSDAGLWYGGSAVDNQAWFDFDGKALETAKIYSYIRASATAKESGNSIANVKSDLLAKIAVGTAINWETITDIEVIFADGKKYTGVDSEVEGNPNAGSPITALSVKWEEKQQELVNTDQAGEYAVAGIVTCTYKTKNDAEEAEQAETRTETFSVVLTIQVLPSGNILKNPGFENGADGWTVSDTKDAEAKNSNTTPHGGSYSMHFYDVDGDGLNFSVEQRVADVKAGIYTFGGYLQGEATSTDFQNAYVKVYNENDELIGNYRKSCSMGGYNNWMQPEVTGIKISDGDYMLVGMEVKVQKANSWGTMDDFYLYGDYGIDVDASVQNGKLTVSNLEPSSKEIVRVTATPDAGYYLSRLTVTGTGVTGDGIELKGERGTLDPSGTDKASLVYNGDAEDMSDATMTASFLMPDTSVTISAVFTSVFEGTDKIDLNSATAAGFTKDRSDRYVYDKEQEYTGKNIQLDLDLSYKGYRLTTADYTAQYKKNKDATVDDTMAEITLKAKGKKFAGERKLYFKIVDTKTDISKAKLQYAAAYDDEQKKTYYYTGDYVEPDVAAFVDKDGNKIKDREGQELVPAAGTDYTVKYVNNIKVGKATMIVVAKSGSKKIKGSVTQTFTIAKRPVTDASITVSKPSGGTYTGAKVTPNVTVKYGSKVLQKGRDYKVTYYNNTNASTTVTDPKKLPYLKITGAGNYTGSTDKDDKGEKLTFTIWEKDIDDFSVTAAVTDLIDNGKEQAVKIAVKDGKRTLSSGRQYRITTITDERGKEIYKYDKQKPTAKVKAKGTYAVTLEGLGNYSGTKTEKLKVVGEEYMLSKAVITRIPDQIYTGNKIELENILEVKNKKGDSLEYNEDYTAVYTNNIKAGTAKVTIKAKNGSGYAGSKTASFKIKKRTIVADGTNLKPNQKIEDCGVITYEFPETDLIYRNGSDGVYYYPYTGYNWMPEVKVYSNNGKVRKPLAKGIDYTISFSNNQKPNDCLEAKKRACITINGKGSYSGRVKFEDAFVVKDLRIDDFAIMVKPAIYNGKAMKPDITFVYKETGTTLQMKAGTAYTVQYKNNRDAASSVSKNKEGVDSGPYAIIKEKGLRAYNGVDASGKPVSCKSGDKQAIEVRFTITTAAITAASVSDIKVQTYNGKPSKPRMSVKVNGKSLREGKDYLVTYTGNVGRNERAVATVTGIGNYSGKVEKTFVIK